MAEIKKKTFVGCKLFEWQADVHRGLLKNGIGSHHIHCVKSKRQVGKSLLIIGELLYFAINYTGTINCAISPTLNQARKLFKEIIKVTENTGVIKKKNETLLEIEFINGSTILFKSAEQKNNLRGYTYTGLLCIDECAYIGNEIFSIVKPSTDVWRCPILMVSTPKFKVGFFYETYLKGLNGNKRITSYDFCQYDTSALLSNEALEIYRQMLPRNQFTTEYLGEFLDADGCVFSGFKECMTTAKLAEYKYLYIGIDWASGVGNDDTVITAVNERGEQVFLQYFNKKKTTDQIDYIYEYLKPHLSKIKIIVAEANSIGTPMIEQLKQKLGSYSRLIKSFTTTNKDKARIVGQLQVAFEQHTIKITNDRKQLDQLGMYEAEYNFKTGNVSYNAPLGGHDDICIALCLCWEGFKSNNLTGNYVYSFV